VQQYNFVFFLSFFFIFFLLSFDCNFVSAFIDRPMILRIKDYLLVSIIVEKTRASHGSTKV